MSDTLPKWMREPGVVPQRRAGLVARVRVNPRDCLSILDVVQSSGIDIQGMSFSAITSLTISCMLESLRKQQVIPRNVGFDYMERMSPYIEGKSTSDKRAITVGLYMKAVRNEPLPEIPSTNNTAVLVDNLDTDGLVGEYHRLKNSQSLADRARLELVQARLDKMNQEDFKT